MILSEVRVMVVTGTNIGVCKNLSSDQGIDGKTPMLTVFVHTWGLKPLNAIN